QFTKSRNWQALIGFVGLQSLGREDSNLRMVESNSGGTFNEINAHSEKSAKIGSLSINRLEACSELRRTGQPADRCAGATLSDDPDRPQPARNPTAGRA